jgi:UDPglucose--hexose-1-phosphate uridylyltransferase
VSQLRLNPLNGRWITVAVERALRPGELFAPRNPVEADPSRPCPFCPGNEEATPPALETYGPSGRWQVRVVPNLYPAFSGREAMSVENIGPVFTQAKASGIHEVLVLCPDHGFGFADLDDPAAGLVMAAIRDRVEEHSRASNIRYSQVIINHGREAGASLVHPHAQLLAMPFVPGELTEERAAFTRFAGSCLLCTTVEAEVSEGYRVVIDAPRVLVLSPFWAGSPFELLLIPKHHETELHHAQPPDLVAVGRALRDALGLLRAAVGDLSYNVVFHTAPHHHGDQPFHWHVHLTPRLTSTAGFEQGTGVLLNIVAPELAAEKLRKAAG